MMKRPLVLFRGIPARYPVALVLLMFVSSFFFYLIDSGKMKSSVAQEWRGHDLSSSWVLIVFSYSLEWFFVEGFFNSEGFKLRVA